MRFAIVFWRTLAHRNSTASPKPNPVTPNDPQTFLDKWDPQHMPKQEIQNRRRLLKWCTSHTKKAMDLQDPFLHPPPHFNVHPAHDVSVTEQC